MWCGKYGNLQSHFNKSHESNVFTENSTIDLTNFWMIVNLSYFYTERFTVFDFVDLQIPFEFYKVSESSLMNGLTYNQIILLHTILPRVQKNLFVDIFGQSR